MNVGTIMFVPVAVNVASEPSAPRATNVSVTSFALGSMLSGPWELPTTRENGDQPALSVLVSELHGRPAALPS